MSGPSDITTIDNVALMEVVEEEICCEGTQQHANISKNSHSHPRVQNGGRLQAGWTVKRRRHLFAGVPRRMPTPLTPLRNGSPDEAEERFVSILSLCGTVYLPPSPGGVADTLHSEKGSPQNHNSAPEESSRAGTYPCPTGAPGSLELKRLRNDPLPNTKRTHRGSFAAASCSHPHVPIGLFTLVFSPAQHLQMLYSYSSNSRARIVRGERDQLPLRGRLPQPPQPNGAASGISAINDQTVHHKWYL